MATASYHQRYRLGNVSDMDGCHNNTWPPHNPDGLPMNTPPTTTVAAGSSGANIPYAPILFQGESVMVLPAQWVFAHLTPSQVDQFVTTDDLLRPSFQAHPPSSPPPLLMLPASTAPPMGLQSTGLGGGGGALTMDSLAEYENGSRLDTQGRAADMSIDIAMAIQDQRPMYFVLSRFQPSSAAVAAAATAAAAAATNASVPSSHSHTHPSPSPQPTEEHLHDLLMAPDIFNIDNHLTREDSISLDFHRSGIATIAPSATMNSPLHTTLTPTMSTLSTEPNLMDSHSPFLPAKEEPGEDNDHDDDSEHEYNSDDDRNENDYDNDKDDNKSNIIDATTTNTNMSSYASHIIDDDDEETKRQNAKRNVCSTCHKTFTRRSNLRTHERLHMRTHVVSCPVCRCTFSRQPDLNRHLQAIHEGSRTHACERCGRSFSRKDAWRVHQASCKRSTPQLK
ncbi:hypothetical protein BGX23_003056 [Mortierella sp. AD031]|nr:hypothetical protein BGX23_003056 [Mortierella sp. AD031]